MVVYNHAGSADGKFGPMQSPAVIMGPGLPGYVDGSANLFVMSNSNGVFFGKGILQGDGPSQWNWPVVE